MVSHLVTYYFLDRINQLSHPCESHNYTAFANFKHIVLFQMKIISIIFVQYSVFIYLALFLGQDLTLLV